MLFYIHVYCVYIIRHNGPFALLWLYDLKIHNSYINLLWRYCNNLYRLNNRFYRYKITFLRVPAILN